ncbi:MAG: type pantothenate kinase [Betaproteobacteria bacterium]|jgi:type III pantothenate kinase
MKLLAIDAGNSRIKWGLYEAGGWIARGVVATAEAHRLRAAFSQLVSPGRVIAANVAGVLTADRIAECVSRFGVGVQWVESREEQCGVRNSYGEPARLGPDRWAALIGARHLHAGACVVVNAGTTMTVDALNSEGIFVGGVIVPGFMLMRNALASNTALLKLHDGHFSFFPDNTADAMCSGALNALAGAVDRMLRYLNETGEEAMVLLSGGDAALLEPMLSTPRLVDNLVLEGLLRIGASDV